MFVKRLHRAWSYALMTYALRTGMFFDNTLGFDNTFQIITYIILLYIIIKIIIYNNGFCLIDCKNLPVQSGKVEKWKT